MTRWEEAAKAKSIETKKKKIIERDLARAKAKAEAEAKEDAEWVRVEVDIKFSA
jgi:hypothetical protein